ncbi:MAG: hypothetical protein ACE5O2_07035, partial [Armatimonadota bacterium]
TMRAFICAPLCLLAVGPWAWARRSLSAEGDTVDTAFQEAQRAAQGSNMRLTLSTVGFRIAPGSSAESYLQHAARIGAYFRAAEGGQLSEALGAAASGAAGPRAPETVVVHQPNDGAVVGPHVDVAGKTTPGALVVACTVVYVANTGAKVREIPGFRRRASETGDFAFRIATPRVHFGNKDLRLRYEVHLYVAHRDGRKGPETVINLFSEQPQP